MKPLIKYRDFYNITDILSLSDVFQKNMHNNSDLDPLRFVILPKLLLIFALKKTETVLGFIIDIGMLHLYGNETEMKGETTQTIKHHVEANNKYRYNFDPSKSFSFISYFDHDNQYGHALSKPMPYEKLVQVEDTSIFIDNFIKSYNKKVKQNIPYMLNIKVIRNHYIELYHSFQKKINLPKKLKF